MEYTLHLSTGTRISAKENSTVLDALRSSGIWQDAPCGGKGVCGKCRMEIDGQPQLACQTRVCSDLCIKLPDTPNEAFFQPQTHIWPTDGTCRYALAFDLGTTSIAGVLLDGASGRTLAAVSTLNPQTQYGADVISRIEYAMAHGADALRLCAWNTLRDLTIDAANAAEIDPHQIDMVCIAGNSAMHHLLLGFDVAPLVTPPYMPASCAAIEQRGIPELPVSQDAVLRVLPNIAGFVGADTVACLAAVDFDQCTETTLLVDIGTNGELVLGNRDRRIACSTAAGPAFEGAKISCGMRGAQGAVDHVWLHGGTLFWHTIGNTSPVGLCGSGLLDLVAALLEIGVIDAYGRLTAGQPFCLPGTGVSLTQRDIREVQLAKAAIRAGIEGLCEAFGTAVSDIHRVLLAGAFGNYLSPASACKIGLFPPELLSKTQRVGNAACDGAQRCALSRKAFERAKALAADTGFLELASLPNFQDIYVSHMPFSEEELF